MLDSSVRKTSGMHRSGGTLFKFRSQIVFSPIAIDRLATQHHISNILRIRSRIPVLLSGMTPCILSVYIYAIGYAYVYNTL